MICDELLEIIDNRARKIASENKTVYIKATVAEVSLDGLTAAVVYAADNTRHTLLNKTGERLNTGDNVFIEVVGGDMSSAVIHMRFGKSRPFNDVSLVDEGSYITLTINGTSYNLTKYIGGQ